MNKEKKKVTEKIFNHALEIISLLTGEVSLLQHMSKSLKIIAMNRNKKHMKRILNKALEIIYLLSGEEYTLVKKKSPHSSIHQLTGEYENTAVSLSMEVWEHAEDQKDLLDENHKSFNVLVSPSSNGPDLQDENVDPISEEDDDEDEIDEKESLQITIHSDLCAGPSNEKSSVFSKFEQEEEPSLRGYQKVEEEEIPISICDGLQDENLQTVSINEEGEYEGDEGDILPIKVHSDTCTPCTDGSKRRSSDHDSCRSKSAKRAPEEFACTNCGKYFSQKPDLVNHQQLHKDEKPFTCSECGKGFVRNASLIVHYRIHAGDKPFTCSECGKCFSDKSNYLRHQRIHTGEKSFACSECGKYFSKLSLIEHQRTHREEKQFACPDCGKWFNQKSNLITHQKIHSGERPFSCSVCGKCFSRKSDLIKHQRIHTGEKPFACSECGKCFSQKSALVNHQRIHTFEK